jgi:hypothetical protein
MGEGLILCTKFPRQEAPQQGMCLIKCVLIFLLTRGREQQ